ncbi:hypothetical protein CXB51_018408 [Gossypium anomalum]|uniref:Ribosomal protein S3 C-terminal domain-containing protein n=1 Tax=Gossypium anomalum TaxID=47600 RepID=A0A8J6CU80_9ROSI|nr:hypothetical protein CXB51_018408 [Gossypium anomalum]
MKFKDGYMISSGYPVKEYIDSAVRHVLLRHGVLGIKVKIMLDWDPMTPLPDLVTIHPPKDEEEFKEKLFPQPISRFRFWFRAIMLCPQTSLYYLLCSSALIYISRTITGCPCMN